MTQKWLHTKYQVSSNCKTKKKRRELQHCDKLHKNE